MTKTITVTHDGETLRPSGPLDLERDRPYRVTLEEAPPATGTCDAWSELEALAGTVDAPRDWAQEHDHYLYGSPKRGAKGRE